LELLAVTAIIAVLIAILLPVVAKARQQAYTIKCAANLRAQGQALVMYIEQYRAYPACYVTNHTANLFAIWPPRLRTMMRGNQNVFYCPAQDPKCQWLKMSPAITSYSGPSFARFGYDPAEPLLDMATTHFSYGYNWVGSGVDAFPIAFMEKRGLGYDVDFSGITNATIGEIRASAVKCPSEMIAIADSAFGARSDSDFIIESHGEFNPPGRIHNGGANVLFCDGHVQWYRQKDLTWNWPGTSARDLSVRRMWNNDHEP
jgi:prepilin-type processing-associated H-X9-DG protein